ncbi:hypothetical protein CYLTODRAFT_458133 [Cylindrobasidium torrendii FP15055 ss-10]|uniref:Uncharacterized protein n=1 Tax=Cylindrobasidium torrendii FP15055 ss-10 TaxID=1314674 RepID=A0A0D7AZS3_9AGAR|nr:hypothetical protein CYLTODRAFT_459780 [Cylindrobasidium torrendii FP15055 ss-10]KIY62704.1 hypothetical protein CYLTODRAFT_458769 [Cylindrobasidium torrendii FP15055 ss-10]KIY63404.1 hypothetical protein CYLTODRAFT_458133 [Cylindrobasidium torrendii FP15055 ss-10]
MEPLSPSSQVAQFFGASSKPKPDHHAEKAEPKTYAEASKVSLATSKPSLQASLFPKDAQLGPDMDDNDWQTVSYRKSPKSRVQEKDVGRRQHKVKEPASAPMTQGKQEFNAQGSEPVQRPPPATIQDSVSAPASGATKTRPRPRQASKVANVASFTPPPPSRVLDFTALNDKHQSVTRPPSPMPSPFSATRTKALRRHGALQRIVASPPSSPPKSNTNTLQALRERRAELLAEHLQIEEQIKALLPPNPDDELLDDNNTMDISMFVDVEAVESDHNEDNESIEDNENNDFEDEENEESSLSEGSLEEDGGNDNANDIGSVSQPQSPNVDVKKDSPGYATLQDEMDVDGKETEDIYLDDAELLGRRNIPNVLSADDSQPRKDAHTPFVKFDKDHDKHYALLSALQLPTCRLSVFYKGYPNRELPYNKCSPFLRSASALPSNYLCLEDSETLDTYSPTVQQSVMRTLTFTFMPHKLSNLGQVPLPLLKGQPWASGPRNGQILTWEGSNNVVVGVIPGIIARSNLVTPHITEAANHTMAHHSVDIAPTEQEQRSIFSICGEILGYTETKGPVEVIDNHKYLHITTEPTFEVTDAIKKGKVPAKLVDFDPSVALASEPTNASAPPKKSPMKTKRSDTGSGAQRGRRQFSQNIPVYRAPGWNSSPKEYEQFFANPSALERYSGEIPVNAVVIVGYTAYTVKKTESLFSASLVLNGHFILLLGTEGHLEDEAQDHSLPLATATLEPPKGQEGEPQDTTRSKRKAPKDDELPSAKRPNKQGSAAAPGPKRGGKSAGASSSTSRRASTRSATKAAAQSGA